jgi:hypothetical protein
MCATLAHPVYAEKSSTVYLNMLGLNMHRGSTITSATCPRGIGFGDGCTGASVTATTQHSTFFTAYANQSSQTYTTRPSWNVAGVEYPVGSVASGGLVDVSTGVNATLTASGCTWGGTSGGHAYDWYCNGTGTLNVSGMYFNGVSLTILGGTYTAITVNNSYFQCNSRISQPAMLLMGNLSGINFTVTNSTFDGQSYSGGSCATASAITSALQDNRRGGTDSLTVQYNAFLNSPTRAITMNGDDTSTIKYNYFENVSGYNGIHGESIIQGGDIVTTIRDIEYNTFFQNATPWLDYVLGNGTVAAGVLTISSVVSTGGNGIVTLNQGRIAGSSIPNGVYPTSFGTATGSGAGLVGTYNLNNSGFTILPSQLIQFRGPGDITAHSFGQGNYATNYAASYVFSNNVLVSNAFNGVATQGGLYYPTGYFFGSYAIQNNYLDPTGAALCYYGNTSSGLNSITSSSGSPTITVANTAGVNVGEVLVNNNMGFTAASTVLSKTGTTITMSSNATTNTSVGTMTMNGASYLTFSGNTNMLNGEAENSSSPTCTGHGN